MSGLLLMLAEPVFVCNIAVTIVSLPGLTSTLFSQTLYPSMLTSTWCVPCGTDLKLAGVVPTSFPSKNIFADVGSLLKVIVPCVVVSSTFKDVSFSDSTSTSLLHVSYPSSLISKRCLPVFILSKVIGVIPTLLPSMKISACDGLLSIATEQSLP